MEEQAIDLQIPETDIELQEAVTGAINSMVMVRESHVPLEVSVKSGVVTLNGVVLTGVMRRGVLYKVTTTPGVHKVIDNLYEDPQIEGAVARALATDDSLKKQPPFVTVASYRGDVTLSGRVASDEERETIKAIASGVAGVRRVFDQLTIVEPE